MMANRQLEFRKSINDLQLMANTIRTLSIDAVEKAGSGHAGTPMGCAELGAYLYGYFLRYNLENPKWVNRDRFILSAGHASMLQYACLHLSGFNLTLADLKNYRQLNSKTPSHPEYHLTEGVETTTGVDGQGIAHGVGQALGLKLLGERFNRKPFSVYDAKVVMLAGDGCLMEGVSHEACAFAGHLNLNNLILIHDSNQTSLDGFVSESSSENTLKRFQAYDWDVYKIDGHDFNSIHKVFSSLRKKQKKPALIIADTLIGKGSLTQAGSYLIHNGPIGKKESGKIKKQLSLPAKNFHVSEKISEFFSKKSKGDKTWEKGFSKWKTLYPELFKEFKKIEEGWLPENLEAQLLQFKMPVEISGRKASNNVINFLSLILPGLYGGSADLARSDMTHMDPHSIVTSQNYLGRNIKYGVREFGMGGVAIGLSQVGITPFVGTFLAFSDYMLSAIRMAALMKVRVIYQFTHDSIFIGQDGPTHQPCEHLAYLRSIPNLQVIRPADANEVKMAWLAALNYPGPTALILSRQELSLIPGTNKSYNEGVGRGAYFVKSSKGKVDFTLYATGSEVSLALKVSAVLQKKGFTSSVVSMPCWELFESQSNEYKASILKPNKRFRVSLEALSGFGWHKYILDGKVIGMETFGKSALPQDLAEFFGFTVNQIVAKILS